MELFSMRCDNCGVIQQSAPMSDHKGHARVRPLEGWATVWLTLGEKTRPLHFCGPDCFSEKADTLDGVYSV